MNTKITTAARCMHARKNRLEHPSGTFDTAGRWYPDDDERQYCCGWIRGPSRAYPYSYMVHCRTVEHIANLHDLNNAEIAAARKVAFADERAAAAVVRAAECEKLRTSILALLECGWGERGGMIIEDMRMILDGIKSISVLRRLAECDDEEEVAADLSYKLPDRVAVMIPLMRDPPARRVAA